MGCLCLVIFLLSIYCLIGIVINLRTLITHSYAPYAIGIAFFAALVSLACLVWRHAKGRSDELSNKLSYEYKRQQNELDKIRDKLVNEYELKNRQLSDKESKLKDLLHSTTPFKRSATLIADLESLYFDDCSRFLRYKKHPARTAAQEVQRVKREAANYIKLFREMAYKYEYILSAFPEIEEYVEDDDVLIEIGESLSLDEIEDTRDRTRDYLTNEEWSSLSVTERNQLALDRYIKRQKSPWQIGRDYELCCSYHLEQNGYQVIQHGILNGVHDLGRDLIAIKQHASFCEYLIIQCKCWNSKREIRENVVFQLYGTYIAYELEHLPKNSSLFENKILCVLMIPRFSRLSAVAKEFCRRLNVEIWTVDYDNFPRIKCNINNGMKIYHLPFDQQYDRTQIKNKGECMVSTVYEAEALGFRRALRHYF